MIKGSRKYVRNINQHVFTPLRIPSDKSISKTLSYRICDRIPSIWVWFAVILLFLYGLWYVSLHAGHHLTTTLTIVSKRRRNGCIFLSNTCDRMNPRILISSFYIKQRNKVGSALLFLWNSSLVVIKKKPQFIKC